MTSSSSLGIAVAQFAPGSDTEENLATIGVLARRAASPGAYHVGLPEYTT
jgi:predicted amidohydrolase